MIFHMIGFLCVRCTLRKEDKGLLDETNRVLESMQKDGFLKELGRKMAR